MKEDEMGGECSMYGGMRMHTKFRLGSMKGRDHLEDLGIDGRIILELTKGK
jgi:hypothetical protein